MKPSEHESTAPRLRPGWYDEGAAESRPASAPPAGRPWALTRRRFRWGEHPVAEVCFGVAAFLTVMGWLAVAFFIWMLVDARDGPEGMARLAVAFGMPPVLLAAFGSTAVAAFVWHTYWGNRLSLAVGVTTAFAAVSTPVAWLAVVMA